MLVLLGGNGKDTIQNVNAGDLEEYPCPRRLCLVHVDDLASAHIFLLEHPSPKGRYLCSSDVLTPEKISKFLSEKYPDQFPVPSPQ